MKQLLTLFILYLAFISQANAGEYSYECTIENLYELKKTIIND